MIIDDGTIQGRRRAYYVPTYGQARYIDVERVAKKWVYGGGIRWDSKGVVDGGKYSSPGQVYRSKKHYEAEQRRNELWRDTISRLSVHACPDHLTHENIMTIRLLTGLK